MDLKKKTGIVWFRNDLRTNDNYSLYSAAEENDAVIGLYFFDPRHFEKDTYGFKKTDKFRAKFLLETVLNLKENLEKLNIPLLVFHQKPEDVFPIFLEGKNIDTVYVQKEWTAEEMSVRHKVKRAIKRYPIQWTETFDQFLYHPEDIPFEIEKTPKIFTDFRKKCEKYSQIRKPCSISAIKSENKIANNTKIPSIQDLGFEPFTAPKKAAFSFEGGENSGLKRLQHYFWQTQHIAHYKKTRNGLIGTEYSSKFSPWLSNGSISPRTIYWELKKFENEIEKNESTYWLIFELIWRDFFKYISIKHKASIFKIEGILEKEYDWKTDTHLINKWIEGRTEEPFVNANMIELKKTGWMSNRGRQNVASYFAKELKLDWRIGAAYFESLLIDYDVHSNYGNWMYVAGVGNDPRDRKFNVRLQADRYDPTKEFQNLWLKNTLI